MLRKILIGAGVLLALLVLGGIALVTLVDANRFKPQIERFVLERYQRTLRLDGDLAFSFYPSIALSLPRATVSEPGNLDEAASIAGARMSVAVLPLLRGAVVAEKLTVDGLKAKVERRADGSLSIDDLIGRDRPAAAPDPSKPPGPPAAPDEPSQTLPRLDLAGFTLTRGELLFQDRQAGQTITLERLEVDTGRIVNKGETPVALNLAFATTQPEVRGVLNLKGQAQTDLDLKVFGARNVDATLEATSGTRRLEAAHIRLGSVGVDPARMTMDLAGLALEARGRLDAEAFEAKVSAPRLSLTDAAVSGDAVQASVQLSGTRLLQASVAASGLAGGPQALTLERLSVEAIARQGPRTLQAKLAAPLKANVSTGVFELAGLAGSVVVEDPAVPQKAVSVDLAGTLSGDVRKETLAGDLSAKSLDTTLLAKVQVQGFSPPKLDVALNADRVDVDQFLPAQPKGSAAGSAGGAAAGGQPGSGTTSGASDPSGREEAIDLSFLAGLDMTASLSVDRLRARGLELSELKAQVKAANGRLDAAPVQAALYGGRVAAATVVQTGATPAANRLEAKADLTGISIGPLLRDVTAKDLLEGRGNLNLVLNAGGESVAAMKRGLDGSAVLALRDGAIKGINLAETIRSARNLLRGGGKAETRSADASKKTDFTALDVSFGIADGIATSNDLDVRSPLLRIGGEGRADLVASRLDYTVRASVVGTSTGQDGKDLADLRGVTVPVRLSGPFEHLDWQIDWETAGREALKSRAAAELRERFKTDDLEGKAREKLGDALKGLFKR